MELEKRCVLMVCEWCPATVDIHGTCNNDLSCGHRWKPSPDHELNMKQLELQGNYEECTKSISEAFLVVFHTLEARKQAILSEMGDYVSSQQQMINKRKQLVDKQSIASADGISVAMDIHFGSMMDSLLAQIDTFGNFQRLITLSETTDICNHWKRAVFHSTFEIPIVLFTIIQSYSKPVSKSNQHSKASVEKVRIKVRLDDTPYKRVTLSDGGRSLEHCKEAIREKFASSTSLPLQFGLDCEDKNGVTPIRSDADMIFLRQRGAKAIVGARSAPVIAVNAVDSGVTRVDIKIKWDDNAYKRVRLADGGMSLWQCKDAIRKKFVQWNRAAVVERGFDILLEGDIESLAQNQLIESDDDMAVFRQQRGVKVFIRPYANPLK